jgi:hypothetical protein
MANTTYRNMRFRMAANTTSVLTNLTAYVNQMDLDRALDLIEDTAMSDTNRSYLFGLGGTTLTISGMVNTTTDGLFGPIINAATSVLKTVEWRSYATNSTGTVGRFYNGGMLFTNVKYSGSVNNLQTFSGSMTFDGAVNRTSASLGGA